MRGAVPPATAANRAAHAFNRRWKIVAVHCGYGGESLLDTYSREPVAPVPGWLATHVVDEPTAADLNLAEGWLLVRPDGYLAARGTGAVPVPAGYCGG
ncbi:hypothetical protein [Amycolatopsis sp. NPDC051903]|uniref:hypothetical protein n=1 Tax=Amycolatopsis sp. NPDC051903 TaxID=3363936 RepID=UPI0037B24B11